MFSFFVAIAALILGYFFTMLGYGLLSTLLGVRAVAEGFPTEVTGLVMSAYYAGFVIGTQVADKLIGRVGHIRAFAVFAATTSIAAVAHAILVDPIAWGVLRLAGGFGMAGLSMVTESWLNERATNENRGRVLSVYMLTVFIGIGAGQFLLVLGSPEGFMLFSIAAILFCLALIPVSLTRATSPAPIESSRFTLAKMWRLSPLALVGMFAGGLITGAFSGMGAVFATEVGLDTAGVSRMMAIAVLGGLLLQWPLGRLSDKWDRRWVLTVIGLGIDNAVHIQLRYQEEGPGALPKVVATTGSASFLASATTAIGFGAAVTAHHYGVQSMGWLAVVGLTCTFVASTIFFPSLLRILEKRGT